MYLKNLKIYFFILFLGALSFLGIFSKKYNIQDDNFPKSSIKNLKSKDNLILKERACKNINGLYQNNNLDQFYIDIKNQRKWNKNLYRSVTAKSKNMILKKFKKRFSGILSFHIGDNLCKYSAKIRISGSKRDHLEIKNDHIISSMDVNLVEGSINGIKKFKLFVPQSRNYDSEIFTAIIMRKLGFISPRTFFVDVFINDKKHKLILQEKPSKEMMDFHKLNYSALLGMNNNLLYELRSKGSGPNNKYMATIFPELINHKWANENKYNEKISFESMKNFTKIFQKIWSYDPHEVKSFSDFELSNKDLNSFNNLREFRVILLAMGAEHALWNNNRKFYYNPSKENFAPIYYDGNSRVMENFNLKNNIIKSLQGYLLNEVESLNAKTLKNKLRNLNFKEFEKELNESNVYIATLDLKKILKNIIENLTLIEKFFDLNKNVKLFISSKKVKGPHFKYGYLDTKFGLAFSEDGKKYNFCKIDNKECFEIKLNSSENIRLLNSKFKYKGLNYYYAGNKFEDYID